MYHQLTQDECGLCCAAILASGYGVTKNIHEYRSMYDVGRDGMSMKDVGYVLEQVGIHVVAKELTAKETLPAPCIAHINGNHFIVITNIRKDIVHIIDPEVGKTTCNLPDLESKISKYVLIVTEYKIDQATQKEPHNKLHLSRYFVFFKYMWKKIVALIIASLLVYAITIVVPIILQRYIDSLGGKYSTTSVLYSLSVMWGGYLLIGGIQNLLLVSIGTKYDRDLNLIVGDHLLRLPYQYFETRGSGELIYRLSLLSSFQDLFTNGILTTLLSFGSVLVILLYITSISTVLFIITIILLVMLTVYIVFINKKIQGLNLTEMNRNAEVNSSKVELLTSIFTIKATRDERHIFKNYTNTIDASVEQTQKRMKVQKINTLFLGSVQMFIPFLLIVVYSRIRTTTSGNLFAVFSLSGILISNQIQVMNGLTNFTVIRNVFERINDILDETIPRQGSISLESVDEFEFKNISFSYSDNAPDHISNLSFSVKKNNTVALVGETGSGKSTVLKLALGLYKPSSGEILYNKVPLSDVNSSSFEKNVSVVVQNTRLLNKTLLENITLGQRYSESDIQSAINAAQLQPLVKSLPMGLRTQISEFGQNFSGGQLQRIALARALIKKPTLIFLDEATSALDNATEKSVMSALDKLKCTKVIIAHRLSTIKNADEIIVMKRGKIVESGTHCNLIAKNGYYGRLYNNK